MLSQSVKSFVSVHRDTPIRYTRIRGGEAESQVPQKIFLFLLRGFFFKFAGSVCMILFKSFEILEGPGGGLYAIGTC